MINVKRPLSDMTMKPRMILSAIIFVICLCGAVMGAGEAVEENAHRGFEQILDLWRSEAYEELYMRLTHPREEGWDYFASRIVHASRVPACCWEKLQDVQTTLIDRDHVIIRAKVGLEVEGVGTRFATKNFILQRIDGIWKLPMRDILDLSDYNMQRIPRYIYERPPN